MTSKSKGNITKFRQDKRLAVVGGLRSLALLGLLATLVFCIFEYREDLNPQNLKRIASYLASAGRGGEFTSYRFESGLDKRLCAVRSRAGRSERQTPTGMSPRCQTAISLPR